MDIENKRLARRAEAAEEKARREEEVRPSSAHTDPGITYLQVAPLILANLGMRLTYLTFSLFSLCVLDHINCPF